MWNPDTIGNELVRKLLNLNPVTFLVSGFRNCFINKIWFWEQPKRLIYFLIITAILLILAIATYKKLRKDIPDVL
ncbi:aBC-2 type transporter family protein [Clostridium sp. CAG:508]|nr:aBC-2 type transporter family protein [Clostridium sp. CAG:508]